MGRKQAANLHQACIPCRCNQAFRFFSWERRCFITTPTIRYQRFRRLFHLVRHHHRHWLTCSTSQQYTVSFSPSLPASSPLHQLPPPELFLITSVPLSLAPCSRARASSTASARHAQYLKRSISPIKTCASSLRWTINASFSMRPTTSIDFYGCLEECFTEVRRGCAVR